MWMLTNKPFTALSVLAALALTGCDRPSQPGGSVEQHPASSSATTPSASSSAARAVPSKTQDHGALHGQILEYVPEDCPTLRAYVDLEGLASFNDIGQGLGVLAGKALARTSADERHIAPVLSKLEDSGIKLNRDVRELASCVESRDKYSSVISLDTASLKGEPAELLKQAAEAAGAQDPKLAKQGSVSYLPVQPTRGALGFIAPGVLAYASQPAMLPKMAERPGDPDAFADLHTSLAGLRFQAGEHSGTFLLRSKNGKFNAELRLTLPRKELDAIRKDPKAYAAKVRQLLEQRLGKEIKLDVPEAKQVDVSELRKLLGDLDQLEVTVSDDQIVARVSVSKQLVRQAAATAATIDPARLGQAFSLELQPGGLLLRTAAAR